MAGVPKKIRTLEKGQKLAPLNPTRDSFLRVSQNDKAAKKKLHFVSSAVGAKRKFTPYEAQRLRRIFFASGAERRRREEKFNPVPNVVAAKKNFCTLYANARIKKILLTNFSAAAAKNKFCTKFSERRRCGEKNSADNY